MKSKIIETKEVEKPGVLYTKLNGSKNKKSRKASFSSKQKIKNKSINKAKSVIPTL